MCDWVSPFQLRLFCVFATRKGGPAYVFLEPVQTSHATCLPVTASHRFIALDSNCATLFRSCVGKVFASAVTSGASTIIIRSSTPGSSNSSCVFVITSKNHIIYMMSCDPAAAITPRQIAAPPMAPRHCFLGVEAHSRRIAFVVRSSQHCVWCVYHRLLGLFAQ